MQPNVAGWPPHEVGVRPWRQNHRAGTREDRTFVQVGVTLPPFIAELPVTLSSTLAVELEAASTQISALDHAHGGHLGALGVLLLRTESVASSKIEAISASVADYARALHGVRSNASAVAMVAATTALDMMIGRVERDRAIELDAILQGHAALMKDEPSEAAFAGRLRTMQNWIGGSDHSPRNALFVPPPPDLVEELMADLLAFANRDDLPVMAQAAISHAQFESIHPFTDGNGRIGRAIINAILRRRDATTQVVIPLASALVADRERYFNLLNGYRRGEVQPLITGFARAARIAAVESVVTAGRLDDISAEWQVLTGPARADSATAKLLALLPSRPIISAEEVVELLDAPRSSVFAALARLHEAGVVRPLTDRRRNQIWGAGLILDELDDLGTRIGAAARELA